MYSIAAHLAALRLAVAWGMMLRHSALLSRRAALHARQPLRLRTERLSTAAPSVTPPPPAATPSPSPEDEEDKEDKRWVTWPLRNPITTAFFAVVGSWAYSLWVQNKTTKLRDATIDTVRGRYPINEDEILELRALNDAQTSVIASLPSAAAAMGCRDERVHAEQLMTLLRRGIAQGQPLKEEYAVERMIMAMPDAPVMDVRVAAAAFAILSSGPVAERMEAMFELLVPPPAGGVAPAAPAAEPPRLPAERLLALLHALMASGQVPPDKCVAVEDEGKGPLGIARSWYRVPPVREVTAQDWCDLLLRGEYPGSSSPPSSEPSSEGEAPSSPPATSVDLGQFIEMLQSELVCVWGECHRINERRRLQKLRDDEEETRLNPPWYRRVWSAVSGGGGGGGSGEGGGGGGGGGGS